MTSEFTIISAKPHQNIAHLVESFWLLQNNTNEAREVIVLPDGRIDLFFSTSATERFHATLMGLGTLPDETFVAPKALSFAISFKPLAVEYILSAPVAHLLDKAEIFPAGFWNIEEEDLKDFNLLCKKATNIIQETLPKEIDPRKQQLFDLIYASHGSITVKELAHKSFWSSRQINRYFTHYFGLSLKAYCNVLRFRASLTHIAEGKLFPEEAFADQNHFIKEIKKFAGVVPKELFKNQNDRFILLSALKKK